MNGPAPKTTTAPDEALSSLMGAVADRPECAHLAPSPAPAARDWQAVQAAIDEYLEGYERRLDEGCHTPAEFEKSLLVDAIAGLMADDDFINALYSAVTAPPRRKACRRYADRCRARCAGRASAPDQRRRLEDRQGRQIQPARTGQRRCAIRAERCRMTRPGCVALGPRMVQANYAAPQSGQGRCPDPGRDRAPGPRRH